MGINHVTHSLGLTSIWHNAWYCADVTSNTIPSPRCSTLDHQSVYLFCDGKNGVKDVHVIMLPADQLENEDIIQDWANPITGALKMETRGRCVGGRDLVCEDERRQIGMQIAGNCHQLTAGKKHVTGNYHSKHQDPAETLKDCKPIFHSVQKGAWPANPSRS